MVDYISSLTPDELARVHGYLNEHTRIPEAILKGKPLEVAGPTPRAPKVPAKPLPNPGPKRLKADVAAILANKNIRQNIERNQPTALDPIALAIAWGGMDEFYRYVFRVCHLFPRSEHHTREQVAEAIGCPVKTVTMLENSVISRLRKAIWLPHHFPGLASSALRIIATVAEENQVPAKPEQLPGLITQIATSEGFGPNLYSQLLKWLAINDHDAVIKGIEAALALDDDARRRVSGNRSKP